MPVPQRIEKVGFIGLGKMGALIAQNILKAGFDLTVYNRTPEKMKPLIEKGAKRAPSPKEAATEADVVITCLMDDQSVLDTVTGENGLLAGLKPGGVHIGTATISPACATKLAELHRAHGSYYVAGPIFGRPDAAEAGTLLTYVAGDREAIAACDSLFNAYTKSHIYMGEDHQVVNSIKLAMNFMLVSFIELFSEVYTFAEKSGIDPEFTNELILTVLAHPVLKQYATRIRTRDFEPAFDLRAGFKDVELMLQASTEVRAPLTIASAVREKFLTALASDMADKDWSAVSEVTRRNAGLRQVSG
jgi:3-hydroxyisobutyrate dehydrogenase-like beta-hydroxyacid dehydrogenase